jgi:hypothetical protein
VAFITQTSEPGASMAIVAPLGRVDVDQDVCRTAATFPQHRIDDTFRPRAPYRTWRSYPVRRATVARRQKFFAKVHTVRPAGHRSPQGGEVSDDIRVLATEQIRAFTNRPNILQ